MSVRLFVALEPSEAVRAEARRAADHLRRALPGMRARFPDPRAVHLTLVFLGQVDERDLPAIERDVAGVGRTARPFTLHSGGLGAFPTARRPSVLWLGIDDAEGRLAEAQHTLAVTLAPYRAHDQGKRFVPHLTLARVAGLGVTDRSAVQGSLDGFQPARAPWSVDEVVLFRSELRPEGARYHVVARLALTAPP